MTISVCRLLHGNAPAVDPVGLCEPPDRKRSRISSMDEESPRRRMDDSSSVDERVRRAIDFVVDTGTERVDLR